MKDKINWKAWIQLARWLAEQSGLVLADREQPWKRNQVADVMTVMTVTFRDPVSRQYCTLSVDAQMIYITPGSAVEAIMHDFNIMYRQLRGGDLFSTPKRAVDMVIRDIPELLTRPRLEPLPPEFGEECF